MKVFKEPYIKIEEKTNPTSVVGYKGNTIYSMWIINNVTVLSADEDGYKEYHNYMNQVLTTLGEGYTVQKTDVFHKQAYHNSSEDLDKQGFLQREYSKHFEGRISQKIKTAITITKKTTKVSAYNKKEEEELLENIKKVYRILSMANLEPIYFGKEDYDYMYSSILTQNFNKQKVFNNFKVNPTHIDFGDKVGVSLPFFDVEKLELPNKIGSYIKMDEGDEFSASVDNFSFLTELSNYETIVYNQYIEIPNQTEVRKELEKKKNRHEGLSTETYNEDCAEEINEFIGSLEKHNEIIVKSHLNLFVTAKNEEALKEVMSEIATKMYQKNIILSQSSYNQYELFRSIFLGVGATELKDYDLFTTTNNVAVAFFFKESFVTDDESNFYLRFADRQGVPVKVDTSDIPMQTGLITNRNKMILGPSGTGKSFVVNNIFEQSLGFNYDIVVIDVGDSYESLCKFYKGKYITYEEDNPISMNPFKMEIEELNEEKLQTLVELLWIIWEGVEDLPSKTQTNVLNSMVNLYYNIYFKITSTNDKTTEEIFIDLENYNITRESLYNELQEEIRKEAQDYYEVLQIPENASEIEIKKAWRNAIKEEHPDTNINVVSHEKINELNQAYKTLINPIKREEYNKKRKEKESVLGNQKILIPKDEGRIRALAIKKYENLIDEFNITELNFNSLFEFAQAFLPAHLKAKKISTKDFDPHTFLYNMTPFYKGGRYETILNEEVDSSLFDEKFIVFEIDNIKDNPQLFPIVTTVIMDTFIQKMRHRTNVRKALYIEEAWKAIASPAMAGSIKYLYKTVRKFYGEVAIVTQDLADIAKSEVVKDAILGSTDIIILLDQRKMKQNYDETISLLNLTPAQVGQIFTINNLDNKQGRGKFKEFWMRIGSKGSVYGMEVSLAQYLTYTTEKPEKTAVGFYLNANPTDYEKAIESFIKDMKQSRLSMAYFVTLINELGSSLSKHQNHFISKWIRDAKKPEELIKPMNIKKLKNYEEKQTTATAHNY